RDRTRPRGDGTADERLQHSRWPRVRLRLGVRHRCEGRQAYNRNTAQPGHPTDGQKARSVWERRLGTRLLPKLPESPRRLPQGIVERGELDRNRQSLRCRQGWDTGILTGGIRSLLMKIRWHFHSLFRAGRRRMSIKQKG